MLVRTLRKLRRRIGGQNFQFEVIKSSSSTASTGCITNRKSFVCKTKDNDSVWCFNTTTVTHAMQSFQILMLFSFPYF
ncbi:hypothetical protein RIF29_16041 [Crotalaria pallida]|uniref:Uncharacterized protein n=1 Tax=Crotalaria pallida TaxID=3830 RepID=A0AAN9FFX7_CROPI